MCHEECRWIIRPQHPLFFWYRMQVDSPFSLRHTFPIFVFAKGVCFNGTNSIKLISRFLVDGVVIRTVKNSGGYYPLDPFRVYGSIWNASDWATGPHNSRIPINYAYQVRGVLKLPPSHWPHIDPRHIDIINKTMCIYMTQMETTKTYNRAHLHINVSSDIRDPFKN